ncbi:hypothetical protein AB0F17_34245 [Nonomuraea sp. NPDC026600]|uniref:hypothetical protein n=1 Tax=Nonomuraea sp. NPDC026600 TaxID=3155363 RepID=UPI0033CC3B7A
MQVAAAIPTVDVEFEQTSGDALFTWTDPGTHGDTADQYELVWNEDNGRVHLNFALWDAGERGYRLAGPRPLHNTGGPRRLGDVWPVVRRFVALGDWQLGHAGNPFNRLGGILDAPAGPLWNVGLSC